MAGPAVKIEPLVTPPAQGTAPVPGVDDFVAIAPLGEGTTVGEPPIAPTLIASVNAAAAVRRVVVASGAVCTMPLPTTQRPRMRVMWTKLTQAQRDAMLLWFRSEVQQGVNAFSLRVDGSDQNALTKVRQVGPVSLRESARGVHDGLEVDVEVVWG